MNMTLNVDKNGYINDIYSIELKIESGMKQHSIKLNRIVKDSFNMNIDNCIYNKHLKEVNISFDSAIDSELFNILKDQKHKITYAKITYNAGNYNDNILKESDLELYNLIMYIRDITFIPCSIMQVTLEGHMVM